MRGLFVTATDTGVGKTVLSAALSAALIEAGESVRAHKPVVTGLDAQAPIARAYGLMVLTLTDDRVSAITWFAERSLIPRFGLPRTLPE